VGNAPVQGKEAAALASTARTGRKRKAAIPRRARGAARQTCPLARIARDTNADAVVEATVLFPIMLMIFAALVLLATYLPTRAALQRATQHAATALAVEQSDVWLFFDEGSMSYYRASDKDSLANVYAALFVNAGRGGAKGGKIASTIEERGISSKAGNLTVDCYIVNRLIYKEVVVTATRQFEIPVDLSFIFFPKTIPIAVSSTAVVQNGDEFVRSVDLATDFVNFILNKFGLGDLKDTIGSFGGRVIPMLQ
jgi:hypothetical protein